MLGFDLLAKEYDTLRRVDRAASISDIIIKHIINGKNKSAMEYGCGTGLVGMRIASTVESLMFVDSSPEMIKQVSTKIKDQCIENASARSQDIVVSSANLPNFDYIFMSLVLHHIIDTELIFMRLHSLLNKGGHLLIVDLDEEDGKFHAEYADFDGHNGFSQIELIALSKGIGFYKAESETFYYGS